MYTRESVMENKPYSILLDFEIQMDHLISTRPSDNLQKKRNIRIVDVAVQADQRAKVKKSEKNVDFLDIERKLKKM